MITPEGIGYRRRLCIEGENYYLIGVKTADGFPSFKITVPDENKATGRARRMTAERIVEAINEMIEEL